MQNKAVSKIDIIKALKEGEQVTAREAMRLIMRAGFKMKYSTVRQALSVIARTGAIEAIQHANTLLFTLQEDALEIFSESPIYARSLYQTSGIKGTDDRAAGTRAPRIRKHAGSTDWGVQFAGAAGTKINMIGVWS